MLSRIFLMAGALCISSSAMAASSPSIGTVTVRGETKIDNYEIRGSGTVFDGSMIETGQSISSGADLRLGSNAEITLLRDSRGTLYRDHLLLQRGTAELGLTDSFRVQANGVVVVPMEAHSSGIITIDSANSVSVDAKNGILEIRNSSGAIIARVHPGRPLMFSAATSKSPSEFLAAGRITSKNGRYYLTSSETNTQYEVKGDDLQGYDGTSVTVSGVLEATASASGVSGLILASSIQSSNSGLLLGRSIQTRALVGGLSVTNATAATTERQCPPDPTEDCCPGIPSPQCCNPPGNVTCPKSN